MKNVCLLFSFVLVILCVKRTETCRPDYEQKEAVCTRSAKMASKYREKCSFWFWQKLKYCTKHTQYYVEHRYFKCYKCKPKIINGSWTGWSTANKWSTCEKSHDTHHSCIGKKTKKRKRTCTNPKPKHGGQECQGSGIEILSQLCLLKVKGNWSTWGSWTAETECSNTCGKGTKFWIRERSCTTPKPQCGGDQCDGVESLYS